MQIMARKPRNEEDVTNRREEILTAALTVFSEKGYSASTTSEVAKMAGVAEGTIFRYFKTKKELLSAIVKRFVATVSGTMILSGIEKIILESKDKDLRTFIKEILKDRLKLIHQVAPVFQVVMTEALYHPEIRIALYENVYKQSLEIIQPVFARMEASGFFRKGLSKDTLLRTMLGSFAGLILQFVMTDMTQEKFEEETDRTIDLLFYGMMQPWEEEQ